MGVFYTWDEHRGTEAQRNVFYMRVAIKDAGLQNRVMGILKRQKR